MNTSDKVKFYENSLKNGKINPHAFNIWAFLFGAFYFMYIDIPVLFFLFICLPFFCAIPCVFFTSAESAILCGFLIVHFIAGIIANRYYIWHQKRFIEKYKDVDTAKPVEYYPISVKRLLICSILSSGLYLMYWSYKNWKSYQTTTRDKVFPSVCALFFHLTSPLLFHRMNITLKNSKNLMLYGIMFLLFIMTEAGISTSMRNGLIQGNSILFFSWLSLALMFIEPLCFVPVQCAVNKHTTEVLKKPLNKRFYPWEIVILSIGIWFNFVSIFGNPFTHAAQLTDDQVMNIGNSVTFIYRNTETLPNICAQQGYTMQKYPNDFRQYFAENIRNLETFLEQQGTNIQAIRTFILSETSESYLAQSVYEELEQLRKFNILSFLAEQERKPFAEMVWDDKYDSMLTLYHICEDYDEHGLDILRNGPNKNLLKDLGF